MIDKWFRNGQAGASVGESCYKARLMRLFRKDETARTVILILSLLIVVTAILAAVTLAAGGSIFQNSEGGPVVRISLDRSSADIQSTHAYTAPPSTAEVQAAQDFVASAATPGSPAQDAPVLPLASPPNEPDMLGLPPLNFSLNASALGQPATHSRVDGLVTVKKPLYSGDRTLGQMDITIDGSSNVLLDAEQARQILAGQPAKIEGALDRLPQQGLVSFADLRVLGIDLRYSPTEDVIRLNP